MLAMANSRFAGPRVPLSAGNETGPGWRGVVAVVGLLMKVLALKIPRAGIEKRFNRPPLQGKNAGPFKVIVAPVFFAGRRGMK